MYLGVFLSDKLIKVCAGMARAQMPRIFARRWRYFRFWRYVKRRSNEACEVINNDFEVTGPEIILSQV